MPFTDHAHLGKLLGDTFIDSFEQSNDGVLENNLIPAADMMITRMTGLQPPDDAADAPADVAQYAAWIVNYLMIDAQGVSDPQELQHRKDNYDKALEALPNCKVSVTTTFVTARTRYDTKYRIGDLP